MNPAILMVGSLCAFLIASCYAAEEGLVACWRFDRPGQQVLDTSGHGHTATVSQARFVTDEGRPALLLTGNQKVVVPSSPDLNLRRGFTIEVRCKPTDLSDGRYIVFKESEYLLRVDWPKEGSKFSFYVYADNKWEPRVSAYTPVPNTWYHLFAVWDGAHCYLWVNGEPFHHIREGKSFRPTDNPLLIGSAGTAAPFMGAIEYLKIYSRALGAAEIIKKTYGIESGQVGAGQTSATFDFTREAQGWEGREGAAIAHTNSGLEVRTSLSRSFVVNKGLNVDADLKDFMSLRMSVDKGSRADLIFAATKGAGRISFQTVADGEPHTYVFEPWTWVGWGGRLVALGIAPSEIAGATARIAYLRLSEELQAEPVIHVLSLFTDSTLPRAQRPERVVARIRNIGGPVTRVSAALRVPTGIAVKTPLSQIIPALGYQEEKEVSWDVEASQPTVGDFQVRVFGDGMEESVASRTLTFSANPRLLRADYVPPPAPAKTGKYTLWTHYCPLWKEGTHYGWKRIEPWPERKPVLGWYNEGTPEVADWHIKYWLEHGISAVVYCWYRSSINAPVTVQNLHIGHAIHDGLLKAKYLPLIRFAIMWENGCGKGCGSAQDLLENVLPFWMEHYFSHPSYLRVDGKPVLYVWVPRNVTNHLGGSEVVRKTFDEMRAVCKRRGLGGLYIVGCVGRQDKELLQTMAEEGWDASSAYGNSWQQPTEVRRVGDDICAPFEGFVKQQEQLWKFKRDLNALPDITAAMMGWDSRPWKETAFFWSDNTPEKFRDLCLRAKAIMDAKTTRGPEKNTLIFCCWNEFGEGHYIEPTRGYGFSYLDVIRDVFTDGPKEHLDIAPEDVGLGPYDSWYQEARKRGAASGPSQDTAWSGEKLGAWTGMMGLDRVSVKEGILHAISTSHDPAFSSPPLKIRASRYSKVVVEMRLSKSGGAQLFWTTSSFPRTSEAASERVVTLADGQFHAYTFEVGKNEYWGGCLTSLRLDPAASEGVTVEVRSIRLE